MSNETITQLQEGLTTAYIDGTAAANLANNPEEGKKVLSVVEDELLKCDQFQISVAFITMGGITPLLQTLKELENRQIPGQILTTNYLNFSEPRALRKLQELSNITIKMYDVERAEQGFHTKGYIFKKEEIYRIIIGSSNITSAALTKNKEWNTKIVSTEQGEMVQEIVKEFYQLWDSPYTLPFDDFYENYKEKYEIIKRQREIAKRDEITSTVKYTLQPNSMQVGFITNLRKIVESGESRALLISATGTGKTYASAFAMRELGFQRVLFLVHRSTLAKQALASFRNVFAEKKSMGIVGAGYSDYDADYIFAMVETLHKEENLKKFPPEEFDCIVLDEAHHSSANTYQKVMEYFKPKLFLGMTATPDKREDGDISKNVYELFHYQIAYEIRLQQAMEEDLLCPFHYFGISDISMISDEQAKPRNISEDDFGRLTSDERVKHVIEQAEYYGYSGDRVKGLIFCSRNRECEELSAKFNALGYRTVALSGENKDKEREKAFERLAMNEEDVTDEMQPLDYIFSQLSKCNRNKMEASINEFARNVFVEGDWITWASLRDCLQEVAELAPDIFLKKIEWCAAYKQQEILRLFPKSNNSFFEPNYITGILWAIEALAWSPDYLVSAIGALGALAALPYEKTNWSNTPMNSIVSILLPWHPQTLADSEKRKNALRCLKNDNPEVFWKVLVKLLPNKTNTTADNPKPKYLSLTIPEKITVTKAEVYEQYTYNLELAVETAEGDVEKCEVLAKQIEYMQETTLLKYLGNIEKNLDSFGETEVFNLWLHLRERMAQMQPRENTAMNRHRDKIQALIQAMEPGNICVKYRELYLGNRYLLDKGDFESTWKMLEDKKTQAIREIYDQYGVEETEAFGQAVNNIWDMGQFDIVESVDSQKEDNSGKMKPIAKVTMKMHHPVREDLLRYLQSNISKENKAV